MHCGRRVKLRRERRLERRGEISNGRFFESKLSEELNGELTERNEKRLALEDALGWRAGTGVGSWGRPVASHHKPSGVFDFSKSNYFDK